MTMILNYEEKKKRLTYIYMFIHVIIKLNQCYFLIKYYFITFFLPTWMDGWMDKRTNVN